MGNRILKTPLETLDCGYSISEHIENTRRMYSIGDAMGAAMGFSMGKAIGHKHVCHMMGARRKEMKYCVRPYVSALTEKVPH